MHTHQTVEYGLNERKKWLSFDHTELSTMDALDLLNKVVDESDPDTDLPNIVHSFQTAERIRQMHPDKDWFHLVGLIHDLGKVMALYGQPQWSTVGDTYVGASEPRAFLLLVYSLLVHPLPMCCGGPALPDGLRVDCNTSFIETVSVLHCRAVRLLIGAPLSFAVQWAARHRRPLYFQTRSPSAQTRTIPCTGNYDSPRLHGMCR
jgi:hypothetical protein